MLTSSSCYETQAPRNELIQVASGTQVSCNEPVQLSATASATIPSSSPSETQAQAPGKFLML